LHFFCHDKLFCTTLENVIDSGTCSTVYNPFVTEKVFTKAFLRSGELARLAGVSTDTLRHYERKGLLSPRRSRNGYREYSAQMLDRVRLIRRAISVGFTIDELAAILKARDQGNTPCRQVHKMAQAKLEAVEMQLRELETVRDDLRSIISDWDARLEKVADNQRAGLLEALAHTDSVVLKRHSPVTRPSLNQKIRRTSK
jgi:DNA-binding transcriptional MerR regulator